MVMASTPIHPAEGQRVACPPDRGEPGYTGVVTIAGGEEMATHRGEPFTWVSVRHPRGSVAIWPSNRLAMA